MEDRNDPVRHDHKAPDSSAHEAAAKMAAFAQAVERLGSPATVHLGTRLVELDRQAGTACFRFDAKPEFANMLGNVQGGFIAAMLDEAAGLTARLVADDGLVVPTLDFRVSFFAPVKFGQVSAVGRCLRAGKRVAFIEADLIGDDGSLLSRMSVTALAVR